jgi:hypothetical protein
MVRGWLGVAVATAVLAIAACGEDAAPEATLGPPAAAVDAPRRAWIPVDDALAAVRVHVDMPVTIPTELPAGVRARKPGVSGSSVQLMLGVPDSRFRLMITYGQAGFDGCGPQFPREVTVAGQPAILDPDPRYRSTLIWPATMDNMEGHYSLYGRFSGKQLMAFAESMEQAQHASPSGGPKTGC